MPVNNIRSSSVNSDIITLTISGDMEYWVANQFFDSHYHDRYNEKYREHNLLVLVLVLVLILVSLC